MIKLYIEKIKNSDIVKNIAMLASGVVIGYAINTLLLPIIGRVYTPSEIGEYDLVTSIGNIAMNLVCLALIVAIMLPREDEEAIKICKIIKTANLIFLSFFLLVLIIISPYYKIFDVSDNYYLTCFLLVMYIWMFNQQSIYYSFVNRKKLYKTLFWNPIFTAIVNSGCSILLGVLGLKTTGYLLGTIASYVACVFHMRLKVNPYEGKHTLSELWETLKGYKVYPMIQLPANMVSTVSTQLPIQFLGRAVSTSALGGYTMACKILSVPVSLLATPVNRVYYREAAELRNRGENIGNFCFNVLDKNIKLALLPITILIVFGEKIVTVFLGNNWQQSGVYLSVLGILYLLKYCSSCLSGTFVVVGKQKTGLISSILALLLYSLCFGIAQLLDLSVLYTIILYAVADSIYNFIVLFLYMYYTKFSIRRYLVFVFKYIIGSSIIIYGLYYIVNYVLIG